MPLERQLMRWKLRGQIDQSIIDIVLQLQTRLAQHWQLPIHTPPADTFLLHVANSLARIGRGGCVSPLYSVFWEELQGAQEFPGVLQIHQDLLAIIAREIPKAEQTYYLAALHSLVLSAKQTSFD